MNQRNARHRAEPGDANAGTTGDSAEEDWLRSAIDEHEYKLVRYAWQFVGDVERARDVVQDTFMKLCRHQQGLDPGAKELTGTHLTKWLYTVCRNRAIDVARKEKRMKSAPPGHFEEQLGTEASPDASALAAERQATLLSQIERLPNNQQEVIRLKFHGGLSYQQIADVTGLTKSNVGFLLHTAISKLRQRVASDI